ncbi:MAG: hypothetical protein PUC37_08025 [Spirochaetales bacterium]|nr:hypothetical protein [Spirochaetales bacterium]
MKRFTNMKRNRFIRKSLAVSLVSSLLVAVTTLSCEVGLGAAIDTEAPSASITYPPESAIIRDYFYIAGTCDDDDKVDHIELTLTCDGSTVYSTEDDVTIEDGKNWSIRLNEKGSGSYNGYRFPDGSYTVNITVVDGSGRSTGPYARSFTIDNTPPIFIISSPSSITSAKAYGTTLNVAGTVADSSGLAEMRLSVYDESGADKGSYTVKDIDTSDGTSVDFARFNKSAPDDSLSECYTNIYGTVALTNSGDILDNDTANPVKTFKTNVVLTDKAKTYQSPNSMGATSSVGNTTSTVYSYDDVYTQIIGGAPLALTPGELIKNMNGKSGTSAVFTNGGQSMSVKEYMTSKAIDTSSVNTSNQLDKLLKFSLNPRARPGFVVTTLTDTNGTTFNTSGLSNDLTIDEKKNKIKSRVMTGATLVATVSGFGSTEIKGNSLKMWMHRLESGEFNIASIKSVITSLENQVYGGSTNPTGWQDITAEDANYSDGTTVSMSSRRLPTLMNDEFYIVAITGKDAESANLDQGVIYGFMGQPNTDAPVIVINDLEDGHYYTGTQYSSLNLSVTVTGGGASSIIQTVTAKVYYGANEQTTTLTDSNNTPVCNINRALSALVSSLNIPAAENNFSIRIEITARDTDGNNSTKGLRINIDRQAPVINIVSAEPVVKKYNGTDGNFINGTFRTEINVDEVKLTGVSYTITNGSTTSASTTLGTSSTYPIDIDTTRYINGTTLRLNFTAVDEAGNTSSLSSTVYTIQQETDKPKISITNADKTKDAATDDLSVDNLFDLSTKKALSLAVEDDDYINSVVVKYQKVQANGTLGTEVTLSPASTTAFTPNTTTYYTGNYPLQNSSGTDLPEGVYLIKVEAKDKTWNDTTNTTVRAYRQESESFYIAIDKTAPSISENEFGSTTNRTNLASTITYAGTASDTNGLYNNGTGAITAKATKEGESSPAKTWTRDVVNGNWSLPIAPADITADGTYTIEIKVKDASGRTKTVNRTMIRDTVLPVITSPQISVSPHTASNNTHEWYNSSSLGISATVTDSKLKEVQFVNVASTWAGTAEPTSVELNGNTWARMNAMSTANTYAATASNLVSMNAASGATAIAIRATDEAGNKKYAKISAVKIDAVAPQLNNDVSASGTSGDASVYVKIGATESKSLQALNSVRSDQSQAAEVRVALKDLGGSGIDSGKIFVSVKDRFGNSEPAAAKKVSVTLADGSAAACGLASGVYKFTIPASSIENGTVYLRYYDMAGNYTDSTIFTFYVDSEAPKASITSPVKSEVNGKLMISGTAEDETALREVSLYYTTTQPTSSTNVSTAFTATNRIGTSIDCTGLTSKEWEFGGTTGVDFESIANVTSRAVPKEIWIVPVIYDEAGHVNNFWTECRKYKVDLNSDRPVIKFAELRNLGQIFTYNETGEISGTFADDDDDGTNVVTTFIASSSPITLSASTGEPTNATTETTVDLASGEWTFTPANNADGEKNVYFYIKDNAGTKFYTSAAYSSGTCGGDPYIQYNGASKADNTTAISYKIDNAGPSVPSIVLEWNDASTGTADGSTDEISRTTVIGGVKRYYRFVITGHDTSGIASMTMKLAQQGASTNYETLDSSTDGTFGAQVTGSGSSAVTSTETFIWTTPWIDSKKSYTVSGAAHTIEDEILSGSITVTDISGLDYPTSVTFTIDNKVPAAALISPNSSIIQTGTVNFSATASDVGDAGLAAVKWMVPLAADSSKTDVQLAAIGDATAAEIANGTGGGKWHPFTLDGATYKASFTEAQAYVSGSNTGKFTDTTTFATTIIDNTPAAAGDKIYSIPIYILAEDNTGNVYVEKASIRYCPNASIPKSNFTYPTPSDYDTTSTGTQQNFITLGGTIRITGVSEDDMGVDATFIQIDIDAGNDFSAANWNTTDSTYLEGKGYTIVTKADLMSDYGLSTDDVPDGWWGIKCSGTSGWNCQLNEADQLVSETADTARNVSIRVCSVDIDVGTKHLSSWSAPVNIKVDDKAPKIGNKLSKMYQFDGTVGSVTVAVTGSGASETVTAIAKNTSGTTITPEKITDYTTNMFLRGAWYYAVSIEDENAIDSVAVYKDSSISPLTAGTDYKYVDYTAENSWRKQIIYLPISQSNINVSYRISVTDKDATAHKTEQTFNFRIDNNAPDFNSLTSDDADLAATGVTFRDSNYTFDIAGTISDSTDGSGINFLVFYFTRTYGTGTSAVTKIFDAAMQGQSASDGVDISTLEPLSITQGTGTTAKTYTLYGKKFTGGTYSSTGNSYTKTGISTDTHIRKGGLIYIDGMYHIITGKTGDTVSFEGAADGGTTAVFPYAHVVNRGEKARTATVDATTKRYAASVDYDEDGIVETFNGNDFSRTFKAEFYSRDIPDGPATLNCIIFDKAGNVNGRTAAGTISNHAPRLAKLFLGTDLNGDGNYDDTEFNSYKAATLSTINDTQVTEYKQEFTFATSEDEFGYGRSFKVTKDLVVVPEYTGGNGTLRMRYLSDASSATGKQTAVSSQLISPYTGTAISASFTPLVNGIAGDSLFLEDDNLEKFRLSGTYSATTNISGLPPDGLNKNVSFTFWDETDGLTQGSEGTEYFFVRITDLNVDQNDDVATKVYINPFYWNSLNDNSIYGTENLKDIKTIQGHIELEADWNHSTYKAGTTGEFDGDPKVSGKIVVRGTAYDDQRLSQIRITLPGFTFSNAVSGGASAGAMAVAASYNNAAKVWTNAGATIAADGWSFKVYDADDSNTSTKNRAKREGAFFGQRGHQVYWELCLDTSKIANSVALDANLLIQATDHTTGGNITANTTSAAGSTPTGTGAIAETANKSNYRMDIVPYITSVTTAMSNYEINNPSVYARSSTGRYPVYAVTASKATAPANANANNLENYNYETVTLNGFNLGAGTVAFTSGNATVNASLQVTIPAAAKSGDAEYYATLGTGGNAVRIYALNNRNYNNSFGNCSETVVSNAGFSTTKTFAQNNSAANTLDNAGGNYNVYKHFYNRQPNDENNNVLTDDLSFDIWDINQKAAIALRNSKADNPVMKINPKTGRIGFAFSNGATWFSMPNSNNSYQFWNMSYDYMQYNELAFDPDGYSFATSVGGDISGTTNDHFSLMSSRWGAVTSDTANQGANVGGEDNKHIRLDAIGNDASNRRKDRFQSTSMVVNGSNIYIAYYDVLNSILHFRYGANAAIGNTGGTIIDDGSNDRNYNSQRVCYLDGTTWKGLGAAGPYVCIGVTSTNVVVMVWYDSVNDRLMYSYNTTPTEAGRSGQTSTSTGWAAATPLFSGGGKYCKLAVDNANGVHIAAYDTENNAVRYIYLANYTAPGTRKEALVDMYSGVGENLTIDVAKDGSYQVPHISYWSSFPALPKYATLAKPEVFYATTDAVYNGCTETGEFTGIWNCEYVATTSTPQKNTINVGVWKNSVTNNSAGNLAYSTTGTNRGLLNGTNSHASSYAGNSQGICYGNGTNNAVLGYVVVPSSSQYNIETAQKK